MAGKLQGEILQVDKPKLILRSQPAQEQPLPFRLWILLKPDLLPVTLVFAADLEPLANRGLDLTQQLPQGIGIQGHGTRQLGRQLPLHQ